MLESAFNKVAGLQTCIVIKTRLQHRCFHVNIAKFLRTAFFYRTPLVAASDFITISKQVYKKLNATNSTEKTSNETNMLVIDFTLPTCTFRFPFSYLQLRSYKKKQKFLCLFNSSLYSEQNAVHLFSC